MSSHSQNKPHIYQRLVQYSQAGFTTLETNVQQEIKNFVEEKQIKNGAFVDRAGKADLYYSLFGLWLSLATKQSEQTKAFQEYVFKLDEKKQTSLIDELVLILLKVELGLNSNKYSTFAIVHKVIRKGKNIEQVYQMFLIALVINGTGKDNKLFYILLYVFLSIYKTKDSLPCSLVSALLYVRKLVKLKTDKLQNILLAYVVETGGFKSNVSVQFADMLSTAVALFALKETNYDLDLVKQPCLYFIQDNYLKGAFLSGYNNDIKDLEYTFYGLLAIGCLVSENEK